MGRMEKINKQIQREISLILQRELADPRLQFVTITSAEVSKDLQHAKVTFTVLGAAKEVEQAQRSLDGARGIIRKYIGQRIEMRYTPEIFFIYDESVERSARIEEKLKEIHDELEKNHLNSKEE